MRPRSTRSPCAYRPAIAATNSSRAAMLIRLIISPADEYRSGANQMRQHLSFREHFRRGNALILATLRNAAGEPIGIEQLARRVVAAKGFDPGDASLRAAIRERIRPIITRLRKQSTIEGISGGRGSKWKLIGIINHKDQP